MSLIQLYCRKSYQGTTVAYYVNFFYSFKHTCFITIRWSVSTTFWFILMYSRNDKKYDLLCWYNNITYYIHVHINNILFLFIYSFFVSLRELATYMIKRQIPALLDKRTFLDINEMHLIFCLLDNALKISFLYLYRHKENKEQAITYADLNLDERTKVWVFCECN